MLTAILVTALTQTITSGGKLADAPDARWGHEPYGVASPLDVAVHPGDGRIFIADTHADRVVVLAPDFTEAGPAIPVRNPVALDVAAGGALAVLTGGDQPRVTLFDAALKRTHEFGAAGAVPAQFAFPLGVSFDTAGNLFVFDSGNRRVQVFDPAGAYLFEFGPYTWTRRYHSEKQRKDVEERVEDRLTQPVRGDFLPDGRLVVADMRGPVRDPERNRHGGMFSVWRVNVAAKSAEFERFARPDDPYPDFGAGDVCVERGSGKLFYAESDFPLTDHDFVMMSDAVDQEPRYRTNFFPYRFLVHPRGIAVARDGDLLVADADRGSVFAIPRRLFETPPGEKDPLEWPKALRIPVCERERIVLEYTTLEPALSRVEFAALPGGDGGWYDYPQPPAADARRVVQAPAFDAAGHELKPDQPGVFHRVELTGLTPGTRYAWRFLVSDKSWPRPGWSETYVATTRPPAGRTQYLDAEVIILLLTNLITRPADAGARPDPADPGPMSDEEIAGVKERLEWSRRFYWINSRCKLNLRFRYVIEPQRFEPGPAEEWGYYGHDDHRKIDAILEQHGVRHADSAGLCMIYGYRHWDAHEKKWVLSGSGGNTWGSIHDGSGMTAINAGDDTCWLFTHEYGHQMSINYLYSGQVYHFNHFHWNYLPTAYGAHYDGNTAIAREFSDVAYWSGKYGRLHVVADVDGDGIPDDDPNCCLDEQRFRSDPAKPDSDADGLSDLDELMATAGLANYNGAFGMRQIAPVFEPNPREVDTDADGTSDGRDEYPLYPVDTLVYRGDVRVDGNVSVREWPVYGGEQPADRGPRAVDRMRSGPRGFSRAMNDSDIKGDLRLAWNDDYLFVGLVQKVALASERPARLYLELDANADGHSVGADNIVLRADPQPDGGVRVTTQHNDTIIRMKPIWRENVLPNPRDVPARWKRQGDEFHLEIAIPRTKDAGLDLTRFERLAVMFELELDAGGRPKRLRLFEPQELVRVTLR